MGLGDFLHWTSIIRDLYLDINSGNFKIRVKKIQKYIKIFSKFKIFGVYKFKNYNKIDDFKIVLLCSKLKRKMLGSLFINNPYIDRCIYKDNNKSKYPNLVYLKIVSSYYYIKEKFLDREHVISGYCSKLGLKKFNLKPEIYFTKKEEDKVKKFLPKDDFILIEPNNHKSGRSYPFDKYQQIVNKYKDRIQFVQISPASFAKKKSRVLNNVTAYIDKFTFRELLLFMSFSKFIVVNHGGLSIGAAITDTKVIAIYTAWFDPIMTKFKNEISISIATKKHNHCNSHHNKPCKQCANLFKEHNVNIIMKEMDLLLN